MLTNDELKATFDAAHAYDAYLASGTPEQRQSWDAFHAQVKPTDAQRFLISGFSRKMYAVVSSGTWCGDCVRQVPFLDHIEKINPDWISVRYVDRDEHSGFAEKLKICGGLRVPVAVLMNEDFDFLSLVGDRTLSRYRAMAAAHLGASCPLPGAPVPADEIAATFQDWIDEFERAQLICRLSTKLRQRHGD